MKPAYFIVISLVGLASDWWTLITKIFLKPLKINASRLCEWEFLMCGRGGRSENDHWRIRGWR
jgi:hypothetical protein